MKNIILKVNGMVCGGCEKRVINAVSEIEGVESVTADHNTGIVNITVNDNITENVLVEAIEDIGFDVVKEG